MLALAPLSRDRAWVTSVLVTSPASKRACAPLNWPCKFDTFRRDYEANAFLGELEWYWKQALSLQAQARGEHSTVQDDSYSVKLSARYSF